MYNIFLIYFVGNRSRSIDESMKKYDKVTEKTKNSQPDRVRGLINPFDKSQFLVKLTSNRRRWSHTFPESKQSYNTNVIYIKNFNY